MSSEDRRRLLRTSAEIDAASPVHSSPAAAPPGSRRHRMVVLIIIATCCVLLAAWTAMLAATLPMQYRAGGWRGAWVGFDVALLLALAATGWAAWHGRQVLILCLTVVATLLLCDAWFDVVLDIRTRGFTMSLFTAVAVEVPLAVLAVLGARRLLRLSLGRAGLRAGPPGRRPSLWRMPLFGEPPAAEFRELQPQLTRDGRGGPDERPADGQGVTG
jgi:ABC-type amino acid transport substrate-binding protein